MAPKQRNVYLDSVDSGDDDDRSYESEEEDLRKGGPSSKRRKLDYASDDVDDQSAAEDDESDVDRDSADTPQREDGDKGESSTELKKKRTKSKDGKDGDKKRRKFRKEEDNDDDGDDDEDDDNDDDNALLDNELPGVSKPLTKKNLVASAKAVRRSGVVYLSRVPPFMKPTKLRSLLAPYGAINRIFLAPEDPTAHARRVRSGGNKKRSFVDGWVEFVRKRDARQAVDLLNAQTIGGKKKSYYHDDIWSLVYLRGFKWHHLTEQIATENAERASRMRAEIAQTTRENKTFLDNLERSKMLDGMEAKAAAQKARSQKDADDVTDRAPKPARTFKQKRTVAETERKQQPEQVQRVLSRIF